MLILQFMLGIFSCLLIIVTLYILCLVIVKYATGSDYANAKRIISNFSSKIFDSTHGNCNSVDYPIYIGYNGVIIRADLVNNAFCKLERYFETVYFDCVYFENSTYPNIVVYQFRAYNQLNNDISKTRLLSLIQNVAEEVLTLHFREMGCYIPVDNFIAVSLSNDLLRIAIAKNPKGFAEIYQLRRK